MLHQYMGRVYSFGYVFSWECIRYWSKYAHKKKNDDSALFIVSFFIRHVYGRARLFHWVHMIERARMGAYFWDSSWCIFWMRVWFAHSFFCERCERPFFIISGSLLYPSFRLFRMWLLSMLWCRVTITHFSISSPSFIFILSLRFTPLHLISFFSHSVWCLTWVQHPHFILAYSMQPFSYHHFSCGDP